MNINYEKKIVNELRQYRDIENVHELPESFHYINHNYLKGYLKLRLGVTSFPELIMKYINILKTKKDEKDIEIISLGSGNCDFEISFSLENNVKCRFTCLEINKDMLKRGITLAKDKNVYDQFKFVECDINNYKIDRKFDIIIAHHSLHHFVNLEHIFEQIDNCMTGNSFFIISDMIGRNGHMFWDTTLDLCNRIWYILPKELKYNHQLGRYCEKLIQWDCSKDGFEGIRAQDILYLLDKQFSFKDFAPFYCIVDRFAGRGFGHNFDPNNKMHRGLLDMIWKYDMYCMENMLLKPTQLIATLIKKNVNVNKKRFGYFDEPQQIYNLKESLFYEKFDSKKVVNVLKNGE